MAPTAVRAKSSASERIPAFWSEDGIDLRKLIFLSEDFGAHVSTFLVGIRSGHRHPFVAIAEYHHFPLPAANRGENAANRDDAEEAVQFSFAAFIEKIDSESGSPPLGWLALTLKRALLGELPSLPRTQRLPGGRRRLRSAELLHRRSSLRGGWCRGDGRASRVDR
jgi:hypothetical protein